ncbi:MAG TPA: AMP-binding protein, partial [Thermoanaerobaculia bacterium]|nr:AMP-binding protein [Thermoanaerobaculia bacterium]
MLRSRAAEEPERRAFTFLGDGDEETAHLTFAGLDARARTVAAALQERKLAGERALLLFPSGLDFIAAFFGCLYAGVVAVPAYLPRSSRSTAKVRALAADSGARAVLTTSAETARLPDLPAVCVDRLSEDAGSWREPAIRGDALAFLQYTSGSTATPKGVMVSHGNLLHNVTLIQAVFAQSADSVVVGWLPLHHDMGLIGNVLQTVFTGSRCILMPPMAFLQQPVRWLRCISRYRATTSGGPDFAYALCAQKIKPVEVAGLDLGAWETAFNGAEPVRLDTLTRFADTFAPCGFRRTAFQPCYGLAEATLLVSAGRWHGMPVSCGRAVDGQRVRVVDPETSAPCPDGQVGEVRVSGPSVALGYWNRPAETAQVFGVDGDGERSLRTGDLGFLADGELYVTGRRKDLIILRGRNVHPEDVEPAVAASHPDLGAGGRAAFAVDDGREERLVVVQEAPPRAAAAVAEIAEAARRTLMAEHEVPLHELVLVRMGTLPRTTSGKVQRHVCRARYLAGHLHWIARRELQVEGPTAPELEEHLARAAALALGLPHVDRSHSLVSLGLDSLAAAQLKHGLEERLGVTLPMAAFLGDDGIAAIAEAALPAAPRLASEDQRPADLSYGQKAIWFAHHLAPASGAYNLAVAVRLRVEPETVRRAVQGLVDRHSSLRTSFAVEEGRPVRKVHSRMDADFAVLDSQARLAEEASRPFDLESGTLLRARLLTTSREPVLLLVVHHIVADFRSLEVITSELASGGGLPPELDYEDFIRLQESIAADERSWEYWRQELSGELPRLALPADRPRPRVQTFRGSARRQEIPPRLAERVRALARSQDATLYTALLAAFAALLHRCSGQDELIVGSPVDGRAAAPGFAGV